MTNVVVLRGQISRVPQERQLPSGDRLTTLDVTVPATEAGARAESVPLAWVGAPRWVGTLAPGSEVVVTGRVRRRFFRAANGLQSRTEVVVEHGAPGRQAARCDAVLRRSVEALERDPAAEAVRRR